MANILSVYQQQRIISLAAQGRSIRHIARELQVHRQTVRQYLKAAKLDSKCTTISTPGTPQFVPLSTSGKSGRKSLCVPFVQLIEKKLELGLSAQRIFQDLQIEVQFRGSYQAVKRFVHTLLKRLPERVHRLEVAPGEELQVDFGAGIPVPGPGGGKKKTWIFRCVLSFSRKAYSEAVFRQDTETFLRCLENAFRHFGGVSQTINLDNLKAAVLKFDFADPELNPKLRDFAQHYGTVIMPCFPRTPEHKGKVENSVAYVKNNALAGRHFESLSAQNQHLAHWEKTVADVRIHGTTKQQVAQLFAEEQKHLLPLPASLFPFFREGPRSVHRDSYIEVEKAYYAAPPEYIGQQVWARWDQREVRLFNDRWEQLQLHRRLAPGQRSHCLGIGGGHGTLQANLAYWLSRASELGADCAQWAQGLVQQRGIEAMRSLMGLVSLNNKHSFRSLNAACAKAVAKEAWRLRDVRALIDACEVQIQMDFAAHHPLIRDLNEYGVFIKTQLPPDSL